MRVRIQMERRFYRQLEESERLEMKLGILIYNVGLIRKN
jgi:hypothetical protein